MVGAAEASLAPKRHATHMSDDARSTVQQATEELEEVLAMARGGGGEERWSGRRRGGAHRSGRDRGTRLREGERTEERERRSTEALGCSKP